MIVNTVIILIIIALFILFTICLIIKINKTEEEKIIPIPKPTPKPTHPIRTDRQPIIVLPGLAGTNLDFSLDESFSSPNCENEKISNLTNISPALWLNTLLLKFKLPCYIKLLEPVYDKINKTLKNIPGLNTFPSGIYPGDPISSICLAYISKKNQICFPTLDYSKNFINFFTSYGYQTGVDLFTLGAEWRLVPYEPYLTEYFDSLIKLVENTYNSLGKRVNLVGHSWGTSLGNIFLNKMPRKWKNKYIESFFPISPSYDGAPKALRSVLSGYDFDLPSFFNVNNQTFRDFERLSAGNVSTIPLLPEMYGPADENGVGNGDAVILCNCGNPNSCDCDDKKVYNVYNYKNGIIGILRAIAKEANQPTLNDTANILQDIANQRIKYGYTDPKVKVYQIRTEPLPTECGPYAYNLSGKGLDTDPLYNITTIGDMTVPIYATDIPYIYKWKDVTTKTFPPIDGLTHYNLYADAPIVYEYILNIVAPE